MEGHEISVENRLERGVWGQKPGTVDGHDVLLSHVQRILPVLRHEVLDDQDLQEHPLIQVGQTVCMNRI